MRPGLGSPKNKNGKLPLRAGRTSAAVPGSGRNRPCLAAGAVSTQRNVVRFGLDARPFTECMRLLGLELKSFKKIPKLALAVVNFPSKFFVVEFRRAVGTSQVGVLKPTDRFGNLLSTLRAINLKRGLAKGVRIHKYIKTPTRGIRSGRIRSNYTTAALNSRSERGSSPSGNSASCPPKPWRRRIHIPRSAFAFTVLELLVATAILSGIVGILFSIFSHASNAVTMGTASVDRHREARLVLEAMQREISAAIVSQGSNNVNFIGTSNRLYFASTVAPFKKTDTYDPISDLQEIVYQASPNASGLFDVTRYSALPTRSNADSGEWRIRRDDPETTVLCTNELSVVCENVPSLSFAYIYESNGVQYYTDSWDSRTWDPPAVNPHAGELPLLVEITFVNLDSRAARLVPPSGSPLRDAYLLRHSQTNNAVVHLVTNTQ